MNANVLSSEPEQAFAQPQGMSNEDVIWELLRLARNGRYRRLEPFLAAAGQLMLDISPERIRRCAATLGRRMDLCDDDCPEGDDD